MKGLLIAAALLALQFATSLAAASSDVGSRDDDCCMTASLRLAGLSDDGVATTRELFRKSGVDQRVFLTGDYDAVSGLLRQLGVASALDAFHIYAALHSASTEKGSCAVNEACLLNPQMEFSCQPDKVAERTPNDKMVNVIEDIQRLESQLGRIAARNDSASTSFTHWGRSDCPTSSNLVYSGWVAGAYHKDLGSGSNPQCMPKSPSYSRYSDYQWGGIMYPAVYKLQGQDQPWRAEYTDKQASCAVCESVGRTTNIMVPGQSTCPTGWTREYYGYLTSANFNIDHRSMFLCFDDQIEAGSDVSSEVATHNLYVVAVDCRSSPICPPYHHARELTCAVCSR